MTQRILVICLAAALGTLLWADVDPDHQQWMKGIAAACGRLKKNVDAKSNPEEMAKDADEIAAGFRKVGGFWKQRQSQDALGACKEAFGAANAVSKAAKAGDMDAVAANFKTLTTACGTCHKAHREKAADGSWQIK